MHRTFDLVVIGTGVAATTVATRCRAAGWSVAIMDELPFGGTCALRDCDPKKVLRRGAEVVDAARLMRARGVDDPGLALDWPGLMAFKRSFADRSRPIARRPSPRPASPRSRAPHASSTRPRSRSATSGCARATS